ncbi:MAG: phenylpyruvate tautomerase MIF-related protein [Candidatus Thiodiazotropha sp.]|jgi:4-oxalocrotonate tautomerase
MPYIKLDIYPVPTQSQAESLARAMTRVMVDIMGKRGAVTAVHISSTPPLVWTVGDTPCTRPTAYVEIKITAGSNSQDEKAALIQQVWQILLDTLGVLTEASYTVIHEVAAENWGYSGCTQRDRQLAQA